MLYQRANKGRVVNPNDCQEIVKVYMQSMVYCSLVLSFLTDAASTLTKLLSEIQA